LGNNCNLDVMYRKINANEYKSMLNLSEEYTVNGMLIFGSWNREQHIQALIKVLDNLQLIYEINELTGFLGKIVEIDIQGKKIWVDVAYGGALLTEYLHLACLFGSQKNILIGTCGGLSEQLESNSVILPDFSFGDGSSASMYQREINNNLYPSNVKLRSAIGDRLKTLEIPFIEGKTMTCQAMLAETMDDITRWNKDGFIGVEMEAAAVFSVSNHFNVASAAMVIIADNLIKEETVMSNSYVNSKEQRENIRTLLYETGVREIIA
jgi:purine-nucleoside phosphorylase